MRRQTAKTFELFFTPKFPIFFLAGALMVAVMGNSLYDLLKKYYGDEAADLWLILVLSVAALIVLVALLMAYSAIGIRFAEGRGSEAFNKVVGKPSPPRRRGLIAFASRNQHGHLERAITYHLGALERVWLITTREAEEVAATVREKYEDSVKVEVIPLDDEFDLEKAQAVVDGVYRTQLGGMAEEDVTADFTGGTKPMSAGMIFACLSPSRKLQYVPADYEGGNVTPLNPIEFTIGRGDATAVALSEATQEVSP